MKDNNFRDLRRSIYEARMIERASRLVRRGLEDAKQGRIVKAKEDFSKYTRLWVLLAVLSLAGTAAADQVYLKNGQVLDGIVVRKGDTEVVVEIAWESHIVLDQASVVKIEMAQDAERKALLDRWHEEHEAFKSRDERQRAFEESQRAKGLIFYRGDWVTREEVASIKADIRNAEAERAKREAAEASLRREEEARKRLGGSSQGSPSG